MSEETSSPRIVSITIENFKGIGAPVTIPIKPITLLFGQNSVGKSSIMESLLLMHDWLKGRGPGYAEALADLDAVRVAVNQDYARPGDPVRPGDEVALFPPVTGG